MKRITTHSEKGEPVFDCKSCEAEGNLCHIYPCRTRAMRALAAYEDTGLTPEEIIAQQSSLQSHNAAIEHVRKRHANALGVEKSILEDVLKLFEKDNDTSTEALEEKEEIEKLKEKLEKANAIIDAYAVAARAIHLHLKNFCDESLPYPDMIADAARKASQILEDLRKDLDTLLQERPESQE